MADLSPVQDELKVPQDQKVSAATADRNETVAKNGHTASEPVTESEDTKHLHEYRFRMFIEQAVLDVIKQLSENADEDPAVIQEIALYVTEQITDEMSVQEMFDAAIQLDDRFSQLSPVVRKVMEEYEKTFSRPAIDAVEKMIQAGRYDQAQDVMKKVLSFKMQ